MHSGKTDTETVFPIGDAVSFNTAPCTVRTEKKTAKENFDGFFNQFPIDVDALMGFAEEQQKYSGRLTDSLRRPAQT